jgi:hypothetical protein
MLSVEPMRAKLPFLLRKGGDIDDDVPLELSAFEGVLGPRFSAQLKQQRASRLVKDFGSMHPSEPQNTSPQPPQTNLPLRSRSKRLSQPEQWDAAPIEIVGMTEAVEDPAPAAVPIDAEAAAAASGREPFRLDSLLARLSVCSAAIHAGSCARSSQRSTWLRLGRSMRNWPAYCCFAAARLAPVAACASATRSVTVNRPARLTSPRTGPSAVLL